MWRLLRSFLAMVGMLVALPNGARAADLRVDFSELARLVQAIAGGAKIRLNNASAGGLMELFNPGSSVAIGNTSLAIPLEPSTFSVPPFVTVTYYVKDINSTAVNVSARAGAVRISVLFESDGPELVGDCVSGLCSDAIMPNVEWIAPALHVDLVPAAANGSIALAVKSVEIGGQLQAVCPPGSSTLCRATLNAANRAITRVRGELPAKLRDRMNAPELQQKLAQGLKPYLSLGPAGEVRISNVAVDAKGIVVSFRF
jgi:hypothetical protein